MISDCCGIVVLFFFLRVGRVGHLELVSGQGLSAEGRVGQDPVEGRIFLGISCWSEAGRRPDFKGFAVGQGRV